MGVLVMEGGARDPRRTRRRNLTRNLPARQKSKAVYGNDEHVGRTTTVGLCLSNPTTTIRNESALYLLGSLGGPGARSLSSAEFAERV